MEKGGTKGRERGERDEKEKGGGERERENRRLLKWGLEGLEGAPGRIPASLSTSFLHPFSSGLS